MPIYEYLCPRGHRFDAVRPMSESSQPATCSCGEVADRIISAVRVTPDIMPYQSPIDGRYIGSRRQRREDLKRNGCREWEPSEMHEAHKRRAEAEAALDKKVDEAIDREIAQLGL